MSAIENIEEKSSLILVDPKTNLIQARDQMELYRFLKILMEGKAFPATLDTIQKALAAWQVAASLNLPPLIAIPNLAIIHGSISMWGQLPKALAERTGELEDCKILTFDSSQKVISLENKNLQDPVWGAVVQMKRKGRSVNEYAFTETDAKNAGLFGKAGPWKQYSKIMYQRRAMGHAIKFEFPDALMGVPIAEYDHNQAPDLKDVTHSSGSMDISKKIDEINGAEND